MADTRDFLLEEIKHLLLDVYEFLNVTLKKEKLKKEVTSRRDEIAKEIKSLINKVDLTLPKDSQDEYADVELEGSSEVPTVDDDDGELYEDTTIPDSPNKNVMSQGSETSVARPEPPELDKDELDQAYGDMKIGPIAATDIQLPTMEGFLDKRRKEGQIGLDKWQRRYCVIKENVMYYFKNRNDKQQKNVIILNGYEARPNPDFDKKHKKRDFLFELVCPAKRSFQFIASSNEEMNAWITAVATASMVIPAPEPAAQLPPLKDVPEEIPENFDDDGETYDDVSEPYQRSKVEPAKQDSGQIPDDSGDIYDDTELEVIDSEDVYEDVGSHEVEQRRLPPSVPTLAAAPTKNRPSMKLPAIPPSERPKPEPPKPELHQRNADEKPAALPRRPSEDKKPVPPRGIVPPPINNAPEDTPKTEPWEEDYSNIYVGMWDCSADDENELAFKRGDLVHIISKEYDSFNWWVGEKNNKIGLVPKEYLMMAYVL